MRILALMTDAFGGKGGIAQFNRSLASAFCELGHEVVILPRRVEGPIQEMPVGALQKKAIGNRWVYGMAAAKTLATKKFDFIFCGHLFMAPLAAALGRFFRTPYWLQLHGIEAWKKPSLMVQKAASQACLVTALSRYTRGRFLNWSAADPGRVRVLPPTYEKRFSPVSKNENGKNYKVLLTVGRLAASERYKGHDKVLKVLPELLKTHPHLRYVIAGDGDDKSRLEVMARELGISDKVEFKGEIPDEKLPDLYRSSDVFVMPSSGEGFGIVFLEAAACGLPVVALDSGGARDALREGTMGYPAASHSEQELARAIARALRQDAPENGAAIFSVDRFNEQVRRLARLMEGLPA